MNQNKNASNVKKTPEIVTGYLKGDRVRRNVGDLRLWVRPPWFARDETPGP